MPSKNYFQNTNLDEWSFKSAFQEIERDKPCLSARCALHFLKEQLREVAEGKRQRKKASAAKKHLENWQVIQLFKKNFVYKNNRP